MTNQTSDLTHATCGGMLGADGPMAWGFGGWSRWCWLLSLDPQNRVPGDELAQVFADCTPSTGSTCGSIRASARSGNGLRITTAPAGTPADGRRPWMSARAGVAAAAGVVREGKDRS